MRTEDLLAALTFKKDARTMIGSRKLVRNGILIVGGSSEARCDERMVSEVARGES